MSGDSSVATLSLFCLDLLNQEVKGRVYGPARVGPNVLGREKAVLLRQEQNPSCYYTLEYLPKHIKERYWSPSSGD
jgi:hypothetical protein